MDLQYKEWLGSFHADTLLKDLEERKIRRLTELSTATDEREIIRLGHMIQADIAFCNYITTLVVQAREKETRRER